MTVFIVLFVFVWSVSGRLDREGHYLMDLDV